MSVNDEGALWKIHPRTVRLMETLDAAREDIIRAFEYGKISNETAVAESIAVLRNLRSVKNAIEYIAKEEENHESSESSRT